MDVTSITDASPPVQSAALEPPLGSSSAVSLQVIPILSLWSREYLVARMGATGALRSSTGKIPLVGSFAHKVIEPLFCQPLVHVLGEPRLAEEQRKMSISCSVTASCFRPSSLMASRILSGRSLR